MRTMSQFQHAQDTTLVGNDDLVHVADPKSTLQPIDTTQAASETKMLEPERPLPPYIPYNHKRAEAQPGRTLVLCFDGTGDQFDDDNSNIVQLVSMLKKDDKTKQMVYYQAGIGTYTSPAFITPLMSKLSKTVDEMVAWNFEAHVIGGYEFLMQNYRPGDKICIFGFSRGAYIARSLAAMIHSVGIIPADNHQQVPFAYKMYTDSKTGDPAFARSKAFKETFSVDVDIEFVGVWDTVDSIGIIPKYFPLMTGNSTIKTFRHALALDEHRSKFNPNLWDRLIDENNDLGINKCLVNGHKFQGIQITHQHGGDYRDEPTPTVRKNGGTTFYKSCNQDDCAQGHVDTLLPDKNDKPTDVEEVWFAGCHCDVGGGSVKNETPHSLARIPLRWMVRECFKANTGILFNTVSLPKIGIDPATFYPDVLERPPLSNSLIDQARERIIQEPTSWSQWFKSWFSKDDTKQNPPAAGPDKPSRTTPFDNEDNEDLQDALSPKYDQLKSNRLWWILEIVPVTMRYQVDDDNWISYAKFNLGDPRFIPHQYNGIKVHRSVKLRMEAQQQDGNKYVPSALMVKPTWI